MGEMVKIVGRLRGTARRVHRAADRRDLRLVPDRRADLGRLPVLAAADRRAQVAGPLRRGRQRLGAGPDAGGRGQPGGDAEPLVLRTAGALGRTERRRDRERPAVPGRARLRASIPPPEHPGTHADGGSRRSAARATARSCCGRGIAWRCSARRCRSRIPTASPGGSGSRPSASCSASRPTPRHRQQRARRLVVSFARTGYDGPVPKKIVGGVAEWSKATVLKTVARKRRGFESLLLLNVARTGGRPRTRRTRPDRTSRAARRRRARPRRRRRPGDLADGALPVDGVEQALLPRVDRQIESV